MIKLNDNIFLQRLFFISNNTDTNLEFTTPDCREVKKKIVYSLLNYKSQVLKTVK